VLTLPPVHLHHFHLNPCHQCWAPPTIRLIEFHGDWLEAASPPRLYEQIYDGVKFLRPAKILKTFGRPEEEVESTSFDFQLNDVRPAKSPKMTWFLSASVLLVLADANHATEVTSAAVSFHTISGPGRVCPDRQCKALPFFVPNVADSFVFYVGAMPIAGQLSTMVFHAHQSALQAALLFSGQRYEFPILETLRNVSDQTGLVLTSATEHQTNEKLKAYLLGMHSDKLLCEASGNRECIEGGCYDRAAMPLCSQWTFGPDSPYVAVSFHGAPSIGPPETAPLVIMHSIWFIAYVADDDVSHYSRSLCLKDGVSVTCPLHGLHMASDAAGFSTLAFIGTMAAVAVVASLIGWHCKGKLSKVLI